mgnify:CR=1 FL=1|tara:strand:+ start:2084 stop:2929 length:846 start_codon:yes stop_codon:yes gene_type:complete
MTEPLKEISNEFLELLEEIESIHSTTLVRSNNAILLCRKTLYTLKNLVLESDFDSHEHEIYFFKNTKQISIMPLIYYSEVRSFELQFPVANSTSQKKYIKKKIAKLNRFFIYNIDFVQYIQQGHSHFDHQYFTRKFSDSYHIVSSKFYFQDPDFTTARDMLLGKVKAYQKFIDYLKNRLATISQKITLGQSNKLTPSSNLHWTSSKAGLTELIYALHSTSSINNGDADIKEIAIALQNTFQFDLGDFYKTYAEIKTRKISRTKFLDTLSTGLTSFMEESEK